MMMTFRNLSIAFALGSAILAGCSGTESTSTEVLEKYVHIPPALPDSIFDKLKPGDIIIRKGNGPLSSHIMNNTKEEYTHCGVIVKEDKWRVIHTIGGTSSEDDVDGVQMIDLDEFVTHGADSMLFICRPIFADSLDVKIPPIAYQYLKKAIPFDHRFSMFTTDKYFCSELLFYIFKDVNHGKNVFDIRKQHNSYILLFATFFDTTKFEPVFHLKYDNLPKK